MTPRIELAVLPDPEALARAAASWLEERVQATVGRFAWCLSGGSTPRALYRLLATPQWRERMPWARVHFFWGDERWVPHDHPDSNYGMARAALIGRVPVPPSHVHAIRTDAPPAACARAYQTLLQACYGAPRLDPAQPLFDVTLLGLGEDGHTASLFPGHPVLEERTDLVAAVDGLARPRITLTYPALESSAAVAVLVSGAAKRDALARLRRGDAATPAGRLQPAGLLRIFADAAAAR